MDPEADLSIGRFARKAGDFEQDVRRRYRAGRVDVGEISSDHQRDELGRIEFGCRGRPDQAAIAQDRDAVGQLEDLIHLVGRIHHRHPAGFQAGDRAEEGGHLVVGKRRGRLIHQDDVRLSPERFGDLDDLGLRDGQRAHEPIRCDIGLKFLKEFFGL